LVNYDAVGTRIAAGTRSFAAGAVVNSNSVARSLSNIALKLSR
jgi:hypothetical protein